MNKLLSTIGSGIVAKLAVDEFKAWSPRLTTYLVARAVRRLPIEERDRYSEEWTRHLEDVPGDIAKLCQALLLSRAARGISTISSRTGDGTLRARLRRTFEVTCALAAIFFFAPLLTAIALAIRLTSSGPVLMRYEGNYPDGTAYETWVFRTSALEHVIDADRSLIGIAVPETRVGKFLRRSGLRHLPIWVGVLRGKESLQNALSLGRAFIRGFEP